MPRKTKGEIREIEAKKWEEANPYFKYYNANPNNEIVGDCVVRAISKAIDLPYDVVDKGLARIVMEETGYGKRNDAWEIYVKKFMDKVKLPKVQKGDTRLTALKVAKDYPKGRYLCQVANHLNCVVDGYVYDIWDSSKKCVYCMWKVREG